MGISRNFGGKLCGMFVDNLWIKFKRLDAAHVESIKRNVEISGRYLMASVEILRKKVSIPGDFFAVQAVSEEKAVQIGQPFATKKIKLTY